MARPVRGLCADRSKTMTIEAALLLAAAGCFVFAGAFGLGYDKARKTVSNPSSEALAVVKRIAALPERSRQGRTIARQALSVSQSCDRSVCLGRKGPFVALTVVLSCG